MYCTFCEIVARREPARIRYEDDEVLVFDNVLGWVPVMLLVIPKLHISQEELWSDIRAVGRVALEMGRTHCPGGFRLLSNLGHDAMQSQPHGHVHVLGGAHLGLYVR
ncbi:MAG: HIT domain-containing protein [Dehalococcoidia bacterium]|nr:HIT domain-containing protein [Dehalococcoidia bacterium]